MPFQQVTLAVLQQRLADRYEAVPYWSVEEARLALNEALRLWNAITGFWSKPFLQMTVPNDPYVALSGTLIQAARVTWNGIPLEPTSLFDFDYGFTNWRGTTTATPGAPSRPLYVARVSLTLLAIYPADASPFNQILVDGVRQTPVLVNPADFIDIGQEELNTLLGYCQHVLAFKVGGQTLVASYPGWLAFLRAGAEQNRQFAASAFYRSIMGLDQLRRALPPKVAVSTLADQVIAQAAQAVGGGGGG